MRYIVAEVAGKSKVMERITKTYEGQTVEVYEEVAEANDLGLAAIVADQLNERSRRESRGQGSR